MVPHWVQNLCVSSRTFFPQRLRKSSIATRIDAYAPASKPHEDRTLTDWKLFHQFLMLRTQMLACSACRNLIQDTPWIYFVEGLPSMESSPLGGARQFLLLRIRKQPPIIQPQLQLTLKVLLDLNGHWIFRHPLYKFIWWKIPRPFPQCCPYSGLFIKLSTEIWFLYPDHSAAR